MGMLFLLFLLGFIPLAFLYLLFTNPGGLFKIIMSIIGFCFIIAVGAGVLFGTFAWLAQQ